MASTDEIKAIIIEPMRALYRVPFGIEDPERALVEYARALKNIPGHLLAPGWEKIIATHKDRSWPTIAEMIKACGNASADQSRASVAPEDAIRLHEARVNPPAELRGALLYESALRNHPGWPAMLDLIHPTAEHNFFVRTELVNGTLEVPNEFHRDWIVSKYGEAIKAHLGKAIHVKVNKARKYRDLPRAA
jgi:hypothetical protein